MKSCYSQGSFLCLDKKLQHVANFALHHCQKNELLSSGYNQNHACRLKEKLKLPVKNTSACLCPLISSTLWCKVISSSFSCFVSCMVKKCHWDFDEGIQDGILSSTRPPSLSLSLFSALSFCFYTVLTWFIFSSPSNSVSHASVTLFPLCFATFFHPQFLCLSFLYFSSVYLPSFFVL